MKKGSIAAIILIVFIVITVAGFFMASPLSLTSFLSGNKDKKNAESIYDEKKIIEMLDSGEISDEQLNSMYLTKDEVKRLLKKVDETKKLYENTITYEYYFEEWTVIGYSHPTLKNEDGSDKTDADGNVLYDESVEGEEIWGWKRGYDHEDIVITNEPIEKPLKVEWQPIYCLAGMASAYRHEKWKDEVIEEKTKVIERLDEKTLDNCIRVFAYEFNYLFDGARTKKTYYKWDELESICYNYVETGDWDRDEFPVGEYHRRTCKKIPASCVSNICNALEQYNYQFIKNTHCTPRYQKPDNWEVDYRIYDVDPDILTRACQLVAPNFQWEWFLDMLDQLPGTEDTVDEEGNVHKGIYSKYLEYYNAYKEGATYTEDQHEIPEKGVIVGEELKEYLDSLIYEFEAYDGEELEWPVADYTRISSDFGYRWHPILGVWKNHEGVDIASPMGTDIYAAIDGVVTVSTFSKTAGNYVVIDHGNGLKTVYMHASELNVDVGQVVKKGDVIAKVGSTGRSTGPHLHFGVNLNGSYVNPWPYLGGEPHA